MVQICFPVEDRTERLSYPLIFHQRTQVLSWPSLQILSMPLLDRTILYRLILTRLATSHRRNGMQRSSLLLFPSIGNIILRASSIYTWNGHFLRIGLFSPTHGMVISFDTSPRHVEWLFPSHRTPLRIGRPFASDSSPRHLECSFPSSL